MIRVSFPCLKIFRNLLLGCVVFPALLSGQVRVVQLPHKFIRSVKVETQDVFPEITGSPRFLYEWANSLHMVTKDRVIRETILFAPGDVFDGEIIEESERKLRSLAYLGDARILIETETKDSVDVIVQTQDQWSALLSSIFARGGGRTTLGVALEEYNLLGYGKQVYGEVRHITEGTNYTLRYTDPQIFFSRWTARATALTGPLDDSFSAQLVRPFYSPDTKWATGFGGSSAKKIVQIFENGQEVSRYQNPAEGLQLFAARAFGRRFHKTRLQLGYAYSKRDFLSLGALTTEAIPDDELIHRMRVTVGFESRWFVEERQIDRFLRTEDLTLGSQTTLSVARTGIPIPKGRRRFEIAISRGQGHRIFPGQYLFFSGSFQSLFEKDTITSLVLRYYNKLLPRQTLALNIEFLHGHNLEPGREFLLGGERGLRGYPARLFSGNKRLLVNIEDRLFSSLNVLTIALGGVVFLDAGSVWQPDQNVSLKDLNYSAGFGLRLGYTKSPSSRVGRIDIAWPLTLGGGPGLSIGVDQQFSIN